MFTVELYAKIRRAVQVEGLSQREAARRYGVHRNTVSKMMLYSIPPGYRRKERPISKMLGPYLAWIDAVLETDKGVHKKQQHSAHRIFERLRDEEGYTGCYTLVRQYVAKVLVRSREMFVPLSHKVGHAQADFGQADAYIAGKKVRFYYLCVDLPQSDACFVKAYPAETAEAFCDGHVAAFAFFGVVPCSILYDNTRLAVSKIVEGGRRLRSHMFSELQSHYLFDDRFGRPGKGNDKGKVEGLVGYARRNFMTPLPVVDSFDALNARLASACTKRRQAILRGHTTTIENRMTADVAAMMALPVFPYDACHKVATRVSSTSLVRYKTNDYSVPTRFGHREVLAKGYVDRVDIICSGELIASHVRSYESADFIYNPLHYLALLERKTKALDQAAPLDGWQLGDWIQKLRHLLEIRLGSHGRREFIQVLRLMEDFHQHQVEHAVSQALSLGAISFDAIKMLLLAKLENRPPCLDLSFYPYLPSATVGATDTRAYLGPSGTGKTHAALALGLAACQKGYSVAFTTAAALVHELMEARDERRLRALQKHLNTVKLLIVDELGYVPFTAVGSELLFEVFSQRYERGATLVTSNLPFDEWTSVFGSERLTGALLDRLTHHVHILEMNGDSFRLAASKKAQRRSGPPS